MSDLAVRVEVSEGHYTDFPGQTFSVFDVGVVVGESADGFTEGMYDGRPTLTCEKTGVMHRKEYAYNIDGSPDSFFIQFARTDKGIFADNMVDAAGAQAAVDTLLGYSETTRFRIVTFVGREAVESALAALQEHPNKVYAEYLLNLILITANYTQRKVQEATKKAQ